MSKVVGRPEAVSELEARREAVILRRLLNAETREESPTVCPPCAFAAESPLPLERPHIARVCEKYNRVGLCKRERPGPALRNLPQTASHSTRHPLPRYRVND